MVLKERLTNFATEEAEVSSESGYTLTETLVALVIFVSVLIPLTTVIGKALIDRSPELFSYALREARGAMDNTGIRGLVPDSSADLRHELILRRTSRMRGSLTEVEIRVVRAQRPEIALLTLRSYSRP